MTEEHMKRAAEWFLYLHEIPIDDAHKLIPTSASGPAAPTDESSDENITPDPYDTGLSAEEGYWARSGWAGRS